MRSHLISAPHSDLCQTAMRDKADGRVGVDHYSIILSSESVTIALTSGDSGRPPMAR